MSMKNNLLNKNENNSEIISKSRGSSGEQAQQKDHNPPNEKEIQRKVEDLRQKLNAELSKLISEEKEKEQERTRQYEEEEDNGRKKEMESAISLERAQSSQRVMKMNA